MRISNREIYPEDNQGQVLIQAPDGTTKVTIDSTGFVASAFGNVQGTTATTGTFAAAAGTAALSGSTWVGNVGTKAYTVSDIISALKAVGILTS